MNSRKKWYMQANNSKEFKTQILHFFIKFLSVFTKNRKQTKAILYRIWLSPIKKYLNTKEWLDKNNLSSNYKSVLDKELIKFDLVKNVENIPWPIFNKDLLTLEVKEIFLAVLPNARYIPEWSTYLTDDNILLNDISLEFGKIKDFSGFEHSAFRDILPKETYIDENIAILDSAGSKNYFHWFINILPKLEFFEQSNTKIDKYIVDISKSFQIDSLNRIGFPLDKIIPISEIGTLHAKNIITVSMPNVSCVNVHSLDFLRKKLNIQNKNQTERIFISRKKALQGRRVINEDEIMEHLSPLGFKCYTLENMSFEEQVEIFSNAETIISPHGAGLTNMLFAPKGTNIVEMFNPEYTVRCYCILANELKHNYFYIKGEGPENSEVFSDCTGNITIDINKIKKIIKLLNLDSVKV